MVSYVITFSQRLWFQLNVLGKMIPPGLEPGTLRVLGARDNHYTTEPRAWCSTCMQQTQCELLIQEEEGCKAMSFRRILFTPILSTGGMGRRHCIKRLHRICERNVTKSMLK